MAKSLFLSIDVCRAVGISPLRTNSWLSFSQADLGPTSAQELFLSVFFFFSFGAFFLKICAHSEWYRNLTAIIVEIQFFLGNIASSLSSVSPIATFFAFVRSDPNNKPGYWPRLDALFESVMHASLASV